MKLSKARIWANALLIGLLFGCGNGETQTKQAVSEEKRNMPIHLKLPALYANDMVLQRNKPLAFWGQAAPEKSVQVTLLKAQKIIAQSAATADKDGHWQLTLPAQQAGGPFQIKIGEGANRHLIDNVLIGDVWVASGQSNMEWNLGASTTNWEQEVAQSNFPNIRFFKVDKNFSATPLSDVQSTGWKVANPQNSADFSAVAWYFAKNYHRDKGIPIAIVDSSWGGTPAEAWTPLTALKQIPTYADDAKDLEDKPTKWQEIFDENDRLEKQKWALIESKEAYAEGQILQQDYDDSQWSTTVLPTPTNQPLSDIVWLRKVITLDSTPSNVSLNMGEINQMGLVFINGQQVYSKSWQDVIAETELPDKVLHKGDNIIAIRAFNSWDNKVNVGKPQQLYLKLDGQILDLSGEWLMSNDIEAKMPNVKHYNWKTGVLYNAMINPLLRFPISGVIWYQGENNVGQDLVYTNLFKDMISHWRKGWEEPDMPFLFVQLASYLQPQEQPKESDWAELREAQASALELPHTAMAVTIDIGEADNIHPKNKKDVGYRLWQAARHVVFNEDVPYSGPTFKEINAVKINGKNALKINYTHIDEGLKIKGEQLLGFAIAGADGKFVNAQATIDGNTVIVSSPKVKQPVSVRYAWADYSPANLYNSADLPAVPFRHTML